MAKKIATFLGALFLLLGIVGFASPHFLHAHLSPVHNVIHLVSGALAVYFGSSGSRDAVRKFCLVFGIFYLLLGVVGFSVGKKVGKDTDIKIESPTDIDVEHSYADTHYWKVIPGTLEFGTSDHSLHVLLGLIFIGGGLAGGKTAMLKP